MKELNLQPEHHLFICCRSRENKPSCSQKGSEQMVLELKSWIKQNNLKTRVKVSKSSCLGHCETGIALCLYPENLWLTDIRSEHIEDLKKMLEDRAK